MDPKAKKYYDQGYKCQLKDELDRAESLYRRSLEIEPSAEAYTYLGWIYNKMGRITDAIGECLKAINLDPGSLPFLLVGRSGRPAGDRVLNIRRRPPNKGARPTAFAGDCRQPANPVLRRKHGRTRCQLGFFRLPRQSWRSLC